MTTDDELHTFVECTSIPKWDKHEFARWVCTEISQRFAYSDAQLISKVETAILNSEILLSQNSSSFFSSTSNYEDFKTQAQDYVDAFGLKFGMDEIYSSYLQRKLYGTLPVKDVEIPHVFTPFVVSMPLAIAQSNDEVTFTYGTASANIKTEVVSSYIFWKKTNRTFTINVAYTIFIWNRTTNTFKYNLSDEPIFTIHRE
jgi:hypothetical protein